MKILVVLDHPYTIASADNVPHQRSFSAAVAAAAIRGARAGGHDVDLIDLAADGFAPAMARDDLLAWRQASAIDPFVLDYQGRLLEANHLAFVFPVWWEAMPAATKGFLDRVLTKGVMYEELAGAKGAPAAQDTHPRGTPRRGLTRAAGCRGGTGDCGRRSPRARAALISRGGVGAGDRERARGDHRPQRRAGLTSVRPLRQTSRDAGTGVGIASAALASPAPHSRREAQTSAGGDNDPHAVSGPQTYKRKRPQ